MIWCQNTTCKSKILTTFAGKEAADPLGIGYVDCVRVLGARDDGKAGIFEGLNIAVEVLTVDSPAVWVSLLLSIGSCGGLFTPDVMWQSVGSVLESKCTASDCEFSVTLEADDEEQEDNVDDTDGTVMSCDEGGSSGITMTSTTSDDSSIVWPLLLLSISRARVLLSHQACKVKATGSLESR